MSDEPFPGIVEVLLTDAAGRVWSLIDKCAVFDDPSVLRTDAVYPVPILLACEVVNAAESGGNGIVRITTSRPWGVEAVDGTSEFDVNAE